MCVLLLTSLISDCQTVSGTYRKMEMRPVTIPGLWETFVGIGLYLVNRDKKHIIRPGEDCNFCR